MLKAIHQMITDMICDLFLYNTKWNTQFEYIDQLVTLYEQGATSINNTTSSGMTQLSGTKRKHVDEEDDLQSQLVEMQAKVEELKQKLAKRQKTE